jgi:hypothetical protein
MMRYKSLGRSVLLPAHLGAAFTRDLTYDLLPKFSRTNQFLIWLLKCLDRLLQWWLDEELGRDSPIFLQFFYLFSKLLLTPPGRHLT